MKTQKYIWIFFCLGFFLSACVDGGSTEAVALEGSTWMVVNINRNDPIKGLQPTLKFEAGQVFGNAGYNHYGGSYQIETVQPV